MLFVKSLPSNLSFNETQAFVQDAVLVTPRGCMAIHPHQIAMLIRGAAEIELHTTFGTVHYLSYDMPTQLGADWRSLTTIMDQNKMGTRCWTWTHQDLQGNEYYLHLNIPALIRVSKAVCNENSLIPTTTVIETSDYTLQLELESVTCVDLVDKLTHAMQDCWTQ